MQAIVRSLFVLVPVLMFAFSWAVPEASLSADDSPDSMKSCYNVRGEARYGALGYNQVVIVTNTCDITLECEVWTDVDPTPRLPLTIGPKGTGEATCRINSPARGFKAFAECKKK